MIDIKKDSCLFGIAKRLLSPVYAMLQEAAGEGLIAGLAVEVGERERLRWERLVPVPAGSRARGSAAILASPR